MWQIKYKDGKWRFILEKSGQIRNFDKRRRARHYAYNHCLDMYEELYLIGPDGEKELVTFNREAF